MESKEVVKQMDVLNNGFLHLVLNLALVVIAMWLCIMAGDNNMSGSGFLGGLCWILWGLHLPGFMVIQPNQCRVLTFFGRYSGTVVDNGFFWTNPFYVKRKLSLRARNMDVPPIKVNDRGGNPIMIGLVLVWRIKDTYKACFNIDVEEDEVREARIAELGDGAWPSATDISSCIDTGNFFLFKGISKVNVVWSKGDGNSNG